MPTDDGLPTGAARTAAVVGAVVVLAVAGAAAFVAGVGPFGGDDPGEFPTATPGGGADPGSETGTATGGGNGGGGSGDGGGDGDGGSEANLPPYAFAVTEVANCGRTCRDVTVELTNNREQAAQNVVVHTRIFAGNTTNSGARIWQGREDVGQLGAGTTTTTTKRVNLGFGAALSVQQNDGWITIQTTVRSADVTRTFTERRDVI